MYLGFKAFAALDNTTEIPLSAVMSHVSQMEGAVRDRAGSIMDLAVFVTPPQRLLS